MTDNMKKFLEAASQDSEFIGKMNSAETHEAVAALAKEKGFILTEEDLKPDALPTGMVDDDELDMVAGGSDCGCWGFGIGYHGNTKNQRCLCFVAGVGDEDLCACASVGAGVEKY